MKTKHLYIYFILFVMFCTSAVATDSPETNSAQLRELDHRYENCLKLSPRLGVRELFRLSLDTAILNHETQRIEKLLELAAQMQDIDPQSQTYGNFKWYWGAEKCIDRNAVEFGMQKGILMLMLYKDRLNPKTAELLMKLVQLSIEGINRHSVPESYTNIFLMKIWNCIAIGETVGNTELTETGYSMLDRWLLYTSECGIHEYLSPTYYGVDLESLGLIAKYAKREEGRIKAVKALKLFWIDIAANWFQPCSRLGGAHSRDYDYLTGHGMLDDFMGTVQWSGITKTPSLFQELALWQSPDDLMQSILKTIPRTIQQRWGNGLGDHATQYMGRSFSIGSSSAVYGPMDKPLTVNLAGGPKMVVANFFLDARGDPYGQMKFAMKDGHNKALHLKGFHASVQHGSEVILLASSEPATDRYIPEPACLQSHFIIPSETDVWIGNDPVIPEKDLKMPVPPGTPVFLRYKDVAVGINFILRLDTNGKPAPVYLVCDGDKYHARRISCVHSEGKPSGRGVVVVRTKAMEGMDDNSFKDFQKEFTAVKTTVKTDGATVDISSANMRLTADVAGQKLLKAEGGEQGSGEYILAVNGRDYGREILNSIDCVAKHHKMLKDIAAGTGPVERTEEIIEAEKTPFIIYPFRVSENDKASWKKYIIAPNGSSAASSVARAVWFIKIPEDKTYYLMGRILAPTSEDDSFFFTIRQGNSAIVPTTEWHTGTGPGWKWRTALGPDKKPLAIQLKQGTVNIEISCREDGTGLDAIMLTTDPKKKIE